MLLGYTLFTIVARLQYDTYRSEHEQVIHSGGSGSQKSAEIRQKYEERKKKYEQLKSDMVVKMQFLDENKVRLYDSCLVCILVLQDDTVSTWRVHPLCVSVTIWYCMYLESVLSTYQCYYVITCSRGESVKVSVDKSMMLIDI